MDLEVVLIEVLTPKDLSRPIPPRTNVVVFCLKGDALTPPRDSVPLLEFTFRQTSFLQKFHLVVQSDFELGFRLSQLEKYRPKMYSQRVDLSPFIAVGLDVDGEVGRGSDRQDQGEGGASGEDVSRALVSQLQEKVRSMLVTNPDLLLNVKPSSVIAQIKNLATGVLKSYQSRIRSVSVQLPQPSEMAEQVYTALSIQGVFSMQKPASVKPAAACPVSVHTTNVIGMIKREGLCNYVELVLSNPVQRAPREKAARNQFTNLVHGLVVAQRQKGVPNLPDEEKLTLPMFNQLKALKVITVQGAMIVYNDEKIAELAATPSLQQSIANAETPADLPQPSDFRLGLLYRAAKAYYSGILSSDECRGRTESAVKEQIRNCVKHALTAAVRECSEQISAVPSVEEITGTIFEALLRVRALHRSGGELRYNPGEIEEVGRRLEEQSLFADAEAKKPEVDSMKKREIVDAVLVEIREYPGLTLGKLDEVCSKRVLAALRFDSKWAASGMDARTLVIDVMQTVVMDGGHTLSLPVDVTLNTVLRDVPKYSSLPVCSSAGDIYSEDQDA